MDYHYLLSKFILLLLVSLSCVYLCTLFLKNPLERQFLYLMSLGVFVWSGIGGTIQIVEWQYLSMFCGFFILLTGSFTLSLRLLNKHWKLNGFNQEDWALNEKFWQGFVVFFLLFSLFPLVYPEFKLMRLINPPPPDLMRVVENRLKDTGDTLPEVLFYYASVLIFPFFLFSLSSLGRRWALVIFALIFYYYTKYCVSAYLPRHEMGMLLIIIFLYLWNWRIIPRQLIILFSLAGLPLLIFFFNVYNSIRMGAEVNMAFGATGIIVSLIELFYQETFYPILVNDLLRSEHSQEIARYLKWIVSLPIPSTWTSNWDYLRINHEFTEFVTGGIFGQTVLTVLLPGILGEAIYIFGKSLWWIHAISVGMVVALVCYVMRMDRRLFFVMTYYQLQAMILGRGGAAMFFILIINYMLLFWPFLIFLYIRSRHSKRSAFIPEPA